MTVGKMDVRDPDSFDMCQQGTEGIGNQILSIYAKNKSQIKIFETQINMEAPDADAEAIVSYTNTFTGAAREVWTVQCVADVAGSLNSTSYHFSIGAVRHYVWMNINAAGVDPAHAGETGHEVAAATNATAATVAAAIQAVTDAIAGYSSDNVTDTNTEEVDAVGTATDMADDTTDPTGFTFTKIIEGTAAYTPNYFYAVSSDAKDTAAGVGARTIRVGIIDANGYPNTTDISMAGATHVKSSVTAIAIYGAWTLTAGSEGDPAGNITLKDCMTNDVYCTITAGNLCSTSLRCWVPDAWNAKIGDVRAYILEANAAAADMDPELGVILTPIIAAEANGLGHDVLETLIVSHYNSIYRNDIHDLADGGDGAYYTFNHVTKADDKNTSYFMKIRYILWSD